MTQEMNSTACCGIKLKLCKTVLRVWRFSYLTRTLALQSWNQDRPITEDLLGLEGGDGVNATVIGGE